MLERLLIPFGFCLIAITIFAAELYGVIYLLLWMLTFEGWWVWFIFAFTAFASMCLVFFIIWMLSIVYWELLERLGKRQPTKK